MSSSKKRCDGVPDHLQGERSAKPGMRIVPPDVPAKAGSRAWLSMAETGADNPALRVLYGTRVRCCQAEKGEGWY